jgi:hypothetical protein
LIEARDIEIERLEQLVTSINTKYEQSESEKRAIVLKLDSLQQKELERERTKENERIVNRVISL